MYLYFTPPLPPLTPAVYVEMTDLLREFEEPAVMDIKVGLRTYLEEELRKKALRAVSTVCVRVRVRACACACACACVRVCVCVCVCGGAF